MKARNTQDFWVFLVYTMRNFPRILEKNNKYPGKDPRNLLSTFGNFWVAPKRERVLD